MCLKIKSFNLSFSRKKTSFSRKKLLIQVSLWGQWKPKQERRSTSFLQAEQSMDVFHLYVINKGKTGYKQP